MKRFNVVFETRQAGAIGTFGRQGEIVEMHQSSFSEAEVIREAMHQLHAKGLETRFAVSVEELSPADPHQAAEAAAFSLTHTPNQPRTTSAQNHLF
jgi:hypothetical protein